MVVIKHVLYKVNLQLRAFTIKVKIFVYVNEGLEILISKYLKR